MNQPPMQDKQDINELLTCLNSLIDVNNSMKEVIRMLIHHIENNEPVAILNNKITTYVKEVVEPAQVKFNQEHKPLVEKYGKYSGEPEEKIDGFLKNLHA